MAIRDEIEKPIVKLIYIDNGTEDPSVVGFEVEVRFKPVNGVVPFPPLKYVSDKRENAATAKIKSNSLLKTLLDNAQKYKKEQLFIKAQQKELDDFFTAEWSNS